MYNLHVVMRRSGVGLVGARNCCLYGGTRVTANATPAFLPAVTDLLSSKPSTHVDLVYSMSK